MSVSVRSALFPGPTVNTRRYVCVSQVPSGRRQLQNDTLATGLPVAVLSEKTHDVLIKMTVAFPVWYYTYRLRGRAATLLGQNRSLRVALVVLEPKRTRESGVAELKTVAMFRTHLWWSLRTLYLLACQVRVTVGDSGLCCCVCVTSFER